ncbi:hypothetical protein Pyn_03478 [Prunus yedoensis var. nudiflora]|uniref:Uncharacterized protein n=1 Tax=Prunus yedoensis var. nudiflora TaxID=2094558 RepID=A0A314ZNU0_PRUYE|nr:hypothetical protein Pyn_03478 [Prunus yedoensis var. nudiflora]
MTGHPLAIFPRNSAAPPRRDAPVCLSGGAWAPISVRILDFGVFPFVHGVHHRQTSSSPSSGES